MHGFMQVAELAPLAMLPSWLLRAKVLKPMKYMAGGTMMVSLKPNQAGLSTSACLLPALYSVFRGLA